MLAVGQPNSDRLSRIEHRGSVRPQAYAESAIDRGRPHKFETDWTFENSEPAEAGGRDHHCRFEPSVWICLLLAAITHVDAGAGAGNHANTPRRRPAGRWTALSSSIRIAEVEHRFGGILVEVKLKVPPPRTAVDQPRSNGRAAVARTCLQGLQIITIVEE